MSALALDVSDLADETSDPASSLATTATRHKLNSTKNPMLTISRLRRCLGAGRAGRGRAVLVAGPLGTGGLLIRALTKLVGRIMRFGGKQFIYPSSSISLA
jgi:hypothetical protein